jgi:Ca2+-binding EF-hand superfamily protein
MYGLDHETNKDASTEKREEVTREVFKLFDTDHNGIIDRNEFLTAIKGGAKLPDFGLGPGHHGDDEFEYEIHHFEKYHNENTKLEDLTHPEDIEHFAKHEAEDAEIERIEKQNMQKVIEANIPAMFRRKSWRMEL